MATSHLLTDLRGIDININIYNRLLKVLKNVRTDHSRAYFTKA